MEYVLKTKDLKKTYGNYNALNGLSMNVPKGSIYGLIGRNGVGKTTLKCRKCVKLTVSNMEVLCNVLTEKGYDYSVISDKEIDVFAKLDITSFVVELAKKECNVLNIQEQDESLENYYINLIGGNRNE